MTHDYKLKNDNNYLKCLERDTIKWEQFEMENKEKTLEESNSKDNWEQKYKVILENDNLAKQHSNWNQ